MRFFLGSLSTIFAVAASKEMDFCLNFYLCFLFKQTKDELLRVGGRSTERFLFQNRNTAARNNFGEGLTGLKDFSFTIRRADQELH